MYKSYIFISPNHGSSIARNNIYIYIQANRVVLPRVYTGSLVITWAEVSDSKTYMCRAEFASSTKTLYSHHYQLVVSE